MRIIAKQKDFYDHAMSYGIDQNVIFNRNPYTISFKDNKKFDIFKEDQTRFKIVDAKLYDKKNFYNYHNSVYIMRFYIAIGGILYKFYKRSDQFSSGLYSGKFFRNVCEVQENIDDFVLKENEKMISVNQTYFYYNKTPTFEHGTDECMDYFLNLKAPIVVFGFDFLGFENGVIRDVQYSKDKIIVNAPVLGMIGVGKFLDQNKIFMDIQNFMYRINEKPTVEINNKDKIIKAGFDTVSSFRGK